MTREAPIDDLAAALVPVLLHKLNNTTQYLSALNALLALGPHETPASCFDGLGTTARDVDELGWLLGVTANACGANLLLERRERSGLSAIVRVTAEILRREGRDLERADRALPGFDDGFVARGSRDVSWRVAWLVGSWLLACGRERPPSGTLAWEMCPSANELSIVCNVQSSASLVALSDRWRSMPLELDVAMRQTDRADAVRLTITVRAQHAAEHRS